MQGFGSATTRATHAIRVTVADLRETYPRPAILATAAVATTHITLSNTGWQLAVADAITVVQAVAVVAITTELLKINRDAPFGASLFFIKLQIISI